ncbi:MFS transporter, NNP family, nitrate/nitrite transporter [Promicromonospora umidemergens]|uniref:NarK/NasA family nitrate transporter n=2 Tax=Promicromonospora umidemergens TaxID=629679 RepID=A0ABP8WGR3_9MICO|nr:MFS transporter, NNP family, nitrate/nitrite transporter [Promicromonospora umidemergens]
MLMLVVAAVGYALNFWAWALLSPLGPLYKDLLTLSGNQQALLVAIPVLVGALGRIPVGALTDRFGGRIMFPAISAVSIIPVLFLGFFGRTSYGALLGGAFFLGVAGTIFAVGVPFVNAWFPPERRGTAVGLYGIGMGGTAIAALTTVHLWDAVGSASPFLITSVALAVYTVVSWMLLRDSPDRTVPTTSLLSRLTTTARSAVTWQTSFLYALSFGGYVAFSIFLPTYLQTAYGLELADASSRMAGFVVVAVFCRPLGGILSDRFSSISVLAAGYSVIATAAVGLASTPQSLQDGSIPLVATLCFLTMAAALGAGSGAVFALVAEIVDGDRIGSATGFVGAAGGLGGFVPPLLLSALYERTGGYGVGLILLALTSVLCLLVTLTLTRTARKTHLERVARASA